MNVNWIFSVPSAFGSLFDLRSIGTVISSLASKVKQVAFEVFSSSKSKSTDAPVKFQSKSEGKVIDASQVCRDQNLPSHLKDLVSKQASHLEILQKMADRGQWQHIREHTMHPESGFDWWMFPVDRPTRTYGKRFTVTQEAIPLLRAHPTFMESYRKGVCLVARSWGWDLEKGQVIANDKQKWTNYQVRLGKMLHSLTLFSENELKTSLVKILHDTGIYKNLESWIQNFARIA